MKIWVTQMSMNFSTYPKVMLCKQVGWPFFRCVSSRISMTKGLHDPDLVLRYVKYRFEAITFSVRHARSIIIPYVLNIYERMDKPVLMIMNKNSPRLLYTSMQKLFRTHYGYLTFLNEIKTNISIRFIVFEGSKIVQ